MHKKSLFLFGLLVFFLLPIHSKSFYCPYETSARLKSIASNINTYYTYKEENDGVIFTGVITNLHPDIYVKDVLTNRTYAYGYDKNKPSEITLTGLKPGMSYRFEVYTNIENCRVTPLYVFYIVTPGYNPYYRDSICKGIEDYSLCQRWVSINDSYDKWKERVQIYKEKRKQEETEIPTENRKESWFEQFLEFWSEYYAYILGITILISIITMVIIKRRDIKKIGF